MRGRTNLRKGHAGRRALRTEQLEKRELLAADFFAAGAAMGAAGNDGVCLADSPCVEVGTCVPQADGVGGMTQARRGRGQIGPQQLGSMNVGDVSVQAELSLAEEEGLLKLREEEKLAHDVYVTLADQWGEAIFTNIAAAESRHMEAVGQLIEKYGLDDPVKTTEVGEFTDPAFAAIYTDLVAAGSVSVLEAYKVGATIEEMDILDLQHVVAETTHEDIQRVYENLMRGSRNHLRAFAAQIDAEGGSYEDQYLSQEAFDAIADSPVERGNGRGGQRGGRMAGSQRTGDVGDRLQRHSRSNDGEAAETLSRNRLRTAQADTTGDILQTRARDRVFANLGSRGGFRRF